MASRPDSGPGPSNAEGFDAATGLAGTTRLTLRLREALCAEPEAEPLALGTLRLQNLAAIQKLNPAHARHVLLAAADSLRQNLPFAHLLARTGPAELTFVLADQAAESDDHPRRLASRVAARLCRDPLLNFPVPLELVFGFAQAPRDGADAAVLLRLARVPQLRLSAALPT